MRNLKMLSCLLIIALLLTGCKTLPPDNTKPTNNTEPPAATEAKPKPQVLSAWTGEFSEENLRKTIEKYQQNCTPFVSDGTNGTSVSIETDFAISSVRVTRLSKVDDRDVAIEMRGYIDSIVETMHIDKRFTVSTDWWYGSDGWTRQIPVWSYLVCVKDTAGTEHHCYFRVQYSTPQNDAES